MCLPSPRGNVLPSPGEVTRWLSWQSGQERCHHNQLVCYLSMFKTNSVYMWESQDLLQWLSSGFTAQSTLLRSCRAWSVKLLALVKGRLTPKRLTSTKCTNFRQSITTALLESVGENDQRNYFMSNLLKGVARLGIEPATPGLKQLQMSHVTRKPVCDSNRPTQLQMLARGLKFLI